MSKGNFVTLIERDLNTVWHPCAQMHDYQAFAPLVVRSADGLYVELEDGRRLIDGYASWWCKNLGHRHPRLMQALSAQAARFEHVGLPHTTSELLVHVSERLTGMTQTLKKVLYASDGSCAVEMALKLSLHARQILGQPQKQKIITLENAYHGETLWTMAVSDLGLYRAPYESILPEPFVLRDLPYVSNRNEPLWSDASSVWPQFEAQLAPMAKSASAIIVEPILQGAAGMRLYSADFLARLRTWAAQNDVHFIADEIMTGLGRVGRPFACEYAGIEPDMLCLGKGLTAGVLPLSATLITDTIYDVFYAPYEAGRNFLHSHTHSGNALALAVALECLTVLEEEQICERTQQLEGRMMALLGGIGGLESLRGIGGVVAADLRTSFDRPRAGFEFYQQAAQLGALLRPLGNTIYWSPPLIIHDEALQRLASITQAALQSPFSGMDE